MNLENKFLELTKTGNQPVTVFLLNGVKLQGLIVDSDEATLLLKRENMTQLVYKHAVSTIMPLNPLAL